jgi:small subunit ribosomal protein S11
MAKSKYARKKKKRRKVRKGKAYVKASFNNTIVTITDEKGDVLLWGSPGRLGFKNSKQSTSYVASLTGEDVANRSKKFGLQEVDVFISGIGAGRNAAVKGLASGGLRILTLTDVTPVKYGGCRSPKAPKK